MQILGTFCAPAQRGGHGPPLSSPDLPCGAIWSSNFCSAKVSALILRLGAATMFPARFPHLGAVVLPRAFLHRHARRLRVASPRGLAWQFLKTLCAYFRLRAGTEKSNRAPPRSISVTFFRGEILVLSMSNSFWETAMPHREGPPQCTRGHTPTAEIRTQEHQCEHLSRSVCLLFVGFHSQDWVAPFDF